MPPPYGTAFTKSEAALFISKKIQIADRSRDTIVGALSGNPPEDAQYYNNKINAFVFSRSELNRLFDAWNEFDVLAIFMAAKTTGSALPTTVIAACKATEDAAGDITLSIPNSIEKPTSETPPRFTNFNIPMAAAKDGLFTIQLTNDIKSK